jgi:predicted PurR-regulated permease PerM
MAKRMSFPSPTEKQARILWLSITALAIGVLLALIGLLLWGFGWVLRELSDVLLPLAIAGVIAYLLDPVVDFFESKKIPRTRAILLVFFICVMLFLILAAAIVPQLIRETENLVRQLPTYTDQLQDKFKKWVEREPLGIKIPVSWRTLLGQTNSQTELTETNKTETPSPPGSTNQLAGAGTNAGSKGILESETFKEVVSWVTGALPGIGKWFRDQLTKVASWIGLLVGLSLVPVYAFYFLVEKRGIQRKWTDYLPVRDSWLKDELVFVLKSINDYLILFFRGQVLVALCDGALLTIGFLIIGLNYAFLLGMFAGLLSIVPYLGVLMSLMPALLLAAVQFGDWLHPVLVLAIFGLVQLAEGLVISPKIMGDRVGLHPLTIIIAVMVGTTLMGGITGGILAIPLTAALRVLMFRYVWKRPGSLLVQP